jgi:hypothetical protein
MVLSSTYSTSQTPWLPVATNKSIIYYNVTCVLHYALKLSRVFGTWLFGGGVGADRKHGAEHVR